MNRILKYFLILLVGFATTLSAQTDNWNRLVSRSFSGINCVDFVDNQTGYAVGTYGFIYKSTDSGESWIEVFKTQNSISLSFVDFVDSENGFAGGGDILYNTTDGGANWNIISMPGSAGGIISIHAATTQQIWMLAESGNGSAIYYTENGGTLWTEQFTLPVDGKSMSFFGTNGIVTGKTNANIYYTTDGINWNVATQAPLGGFNYTRSDIRGVYMVSANTGYAVGWGSLIGMQPSILLKTTDGGSTWSYLTQDENNRTFDNLYSVYFKNENDGIAVGGGGRGSVTVKTTDGGANWVPVNNYCGASLKHISGNGDFLVASGSGGLMIRSTDFGESWDIITDVPSSSLYDIEIAAPGTVYASGYDGLLFKTADSGLNWDISYVSTGKVTPNVQDIYFLNENLGYAAHSYGLVSKTTDGGATWNASIPDTASPSTTNYGVTFINENLGFVVGKLANGVDMINRTTDGGNTWTRKINTTFETMRHVDFANTNNGVIVGDDLSIVYTTDGGESWTTSSFNTTLPGGDLTDLRKVEFLDAQTVIAAGNAAMYKSKDGGANWDYIEIDGLNERITGLSFSDSQSGYAVGTKSGTDAAVSIYYTSDAGDSWINVTDETVIDQDVTVNSVSVVDGNAWVCGYNSTIYSNEIVTDVEEHQVNLPENFEVHQNYPNPFNPATTISFTIPESGKVSIKVYDLLGSELKTLINKNMQAGTHKVNFNAENLTSGIYFYSVRTGNISITRKMILLK